MSEAESQAYCRKGWTCLKFATSECPFMNDGKLYLECDAFKPAIVVEKVNGTENKLREQITIAVGEYSASIMVENPHWVFNPEPAEKLVDQILKFIEQVGYVKLPPDSAVLTGIHHLKEIEDRQSE